MRSDAIRSDAGAEDHADTEDYWSRAVVLFGFSGRTAPIGIGKLKEGRKMMTKKKTIGHAICPTKRFPPAIEDIPFASLARCCCLFRAIKPKSFFFFSSFYRSIRFSLRSSFFSSQPVVPPDSAPLPPPRPPDSVRAPIVRARDAKQRCETDSETLEKVLNK
jgi:hypothetical protein